MGKTDDRDSCENIALHYAEKCDRLETELKAKAERTKELEDGIKKVCDLINNKGAVSKWKIFNWLDKTLEGE